VDPAKLALWSFSGSGGHVFRVAARNPELGAAIAQTPNAGGLAPLRNAARFQKPLTMARFTGRGVLDGLGRLAGRPPRLVHLPGGHHAAFLDAHEQAVAAELTFLRLHLLGQPRPGRSAPSPREPIPAGTGGYERDRAVHRGSSTTSTPAATAR
jgi:hypothetical protein